MKKLLVAMVLGILLVAQPVQAEGNSFALVDLNKVLQDSDVAKDILKQLEKKRDVYHKSLTKEEDKLKDEEKDLLKQKSKLPEQEFVEKRKAFSKKVLAGQQKVQKHKITLDRAFSVYMGKVRAEATKIVAKIAKEKKFSAVFTQNAVLLSEPSLDITKDVLKAMNKEVKKMKIDWDDMAKGKK